MDLGRGLLCLEGSGPIAPVIRSIVGLGYECFPLTPGATERVRRDTTGPLLRRLAVAGACTGNIMLLTTALYSGAEASPLAPAFGWFTFFLFLPVLIYSASGFFTLAWRQLRVKRIAIELPIAIALVLGTGLGLRGLIRSTGIHYFDSLGALVFLLLLGRYVLALIQQKHLHPHQLHSFFAGQAVERQGPQGWETVDVSQLASGELVRVQAGQVIPADGTCTSPQAWLNLAVLTGEPFPQRIRRGERVLAGAISKEPLEFRVTELGEETRLGHILSASQLERSRRSPWLAVADTAAQAFTLVLLGGATFILLLFGYWGMWDEAFSRSLALVVLACPCALGLAIPLAQALCLKATAQRGAIVKSGEALERIAKTKHIIFDKTGTLTTGEFTLTESSPPLTTERIGWIRGLEEHANHPIGRCLYDLLEGPVTPFDSVEEIPGKGVFGKIGEDFFSLVSASPSQDPVTRVALKRNGKPIATLSLSDPLRPDAKSIVSLAKDFGAETHLLSGDSPANVSAIADQLGLISVRGGATPEQKADYISSLSNTLMVGDGINDAVVLSKANVGVAVRASAQTALSVADVYLVGDTGQGLKALLEGAIQLRRAIRTNLVFSVLYNSIGLTLACLGFITPLAAAVLMPLSSLTVLGISVVQSKAS